MKTDELYSVKGAAAWLGGVSKWTVHAWLGQGKLKKTKVGSRTMIRESDLQAFVANCNREPDGTRQPATNLGVRPKSAPETGPERAA